MLHSLTEEARAIHLYKKTGKYRVVSYMLTLR